MSFSARILLFDNSTDFIDRIHNELNSNGNEIEIHTVYNKTDYIKALNEFKPDLVLTEHHHNELSGPDAIRIVKQHSPTLPVLLLTHSLEPAQARECLQAGAHDYILKQDLTRLPVAIRNTLAIQKNNSANNLLYKSQLVRFHSAMNSLSQTMLALYNREGIFEQVWIDPLLVKQYGLDSKSWIGESLVMFYSPKDAIQRIQKIQRVFDEGKTFRDTLIINHPSGHGQISVDVTLSPVYDEHNNIVNAAAFVQDVTDRMMAEQELTRLSTAFEQVAECIVITDTNGNIEYVNQVVERITGYTREELLRNNCRIFKSGKHNKDFYKYMWKTILSGKNWNGHIHNKKKDGTLFEEEVTISPIKDKTGHIKNYVAVKRDVTYEVKMEKQLRQGQKMEAIGTLAGGIAHDFNNILAAILGYTELSLRDLDTESKLYKHMQQVLQAGYRAKDLIKQILAFSRQSQQEVKPLQISLIIKEALKLLRASLPATIEMRQNLRGHQSMVLADPTHIHQVVMNLCTNAAHAMRHNGGLLEVNLYEVDVTEQDVNHYHGIRTGPYIKLSISDNGHGMTPDVVERIFEPYFTTKKQGEGTGMGLSVVHGIIKSHNGDITVYSEPGKGTTFNILLPRLESGEQETEAQASQLPLGYESILFVDDEDTLVEIGQEMLEQLGYKVTAKTNSMEAMEAFQNDPSAYDMIITDQTMPYLTGAELARKALEIRPDIPIVLCTGFSEVMTEEKAKEIGIHEFIMKPMFMKEIAFVVRRLLDHETVSEKT